MMYKQRGSALVIGLILIVGLMLIGVSAVQNANVNYRASSNFNNVQVSFQSAESALVQGEALIDGINKKLDYCTDTNTSNCIWPSDKFSTENFISGSAWSSAQNASKNISASSEAPLYVIQEQGFQAFELNPDSQSKGLGMYYYRVTAKGYGSKPYNNTTSKNEASQTIVESIFAKSY